MKNLPSDFLKMMHAAKGLNLVTIRDRNVFEINYNSDTIDLDSLIFSAKYNDIGLSYFDDLYPSPSDPGAYFNFFHSNESETIYYMSLGNHGWSGGIYLVDEEIMKKQLRNLIHHKLLKTIELTFELPMKYYSLKDSRSNSEMSQRLIDLHN
jgi:hypothetical protein